MINFKQQTVSEAIKDTFEGENMQSEYIVLSYRINLYFHDYKLAIKVDEYGHNDRNIDFEIKTQKAIEKERGCQFIRINPDKQNFSIFEAINEIHRYIEKSTKRSLIDKISKKILGIKFKPSHLLKSKASKYVVQEIIVIKILLKL